MRKLFSLFVALIATATLWAHDFEVDGIYYNFLNGNAVEVTYPNDDRWGTYSAPIDYPDYSGDVVIPDSVIYNGKTYQVTSIGNSAFYNYFYDSSLTSVTIGNNVTSIGQEAFHQCSALTSVIIGKSVTSIGANAFGGCSSLTKTNYTGDIASWCDIKFDGWHANPTFYSTNLYINNQEVTELVIPNNVTTIEDYTFGGMSSLTSLAISDGVTNIGTRAFERCSSLSSVTLPNSLKNIGWGTFRSCTSLDSITIPSSVTDIGGDAFYNTGIYNNQSNWEKGVLYLNNCLVAAKYKLFGTYVVKDSTRIIAGDAFYYCENLNSVTIPNSVTYIGEAAFYGCVSITSVSIGSGVTHIGDLVFSDCDSLKTIYCHAIFPPYVDERTFFDDERETNRYNVTLYVPDEAWIDYKVHDIWGEFENIVPMSTTSVENTHSQSPKTDCQKILHDNQLYIYHNGSAYTIMGAEIQ